MSGWPQLSSLVVAAVLLVVADSAEHGFWAICWCQGYLPVSFLQVEGGYKLGSPQHLDEVVYSGQWVAVEFRYSIG